MNGRAGAEAAYSDNRGVDPDMRLLSALGVMIYDRRLGGEHMAWGEALCPSL